MRILGFSQKWPKLEQDEFTTFRFPRKDKDWYIGERVQIVYKPRSKNREDLGMAEIKSKEPRIFSPLLRGVSITNEEARADGFGGMITMTNWLEKTYGKKRLHREPMNKLTLRWVGKYPQEAKE